MPTLCQRFMNSFSVMGSVFSAGSCRGRQGESITCECSLHLDRRDPPQVGLPLFGLREGFQGRSSVHASLSPLPLCLVHAGRRSCRANRRAYLCRRILCEGWSRCIEGGEDCSPSTNLNFPCFCTCSFQMFLLCSYRSSFSS